MSLFELRQRTAVSLWYLLYRILTMTGDPLFEYGWRLLHADHSCEEAGHGEPQWLQHALGSLLFLMGHRLKMSATECSVRRILAQGGGWQ